MVFDLYELRPSTGVLWILYLCIRTSIVIQYTGIAGLRPLIPAHRHRRNAAHYSDTCLPRVEPAMRVNYVVDVVRNFSVHRHRRICSKCFDTCLPRE